ncbi:MAG TPA: hypothetical protein VL095_03700 [Flavisolibacter sp.]|nr:hypothetical protein [Flavisolibacter sp.]
MKKLTWLLSIYFLSIALSVHAQNNFKIGDAVEVSNIGKGIIVGEYRQTEFSYGTYKVHLDGEKYCNNHALDTRYNANYVTALKGAKDVSNEKKENKNTTQPVLSGGNLKIGDTVLYSQTAVWGRGVIKNYNPETRLYTLQDVYVGIPCYAVAKPAKTYNNNFYVGTWDVQLSGAMFAEKEGDKNYNKISGGLKLYPLQIKKDGTYSWKIASNKTITGKWKARADAPGIVIVKGIDGKDWTVYETTEAFATTKQTRDEIRFHHMPTNSGYYIATRNDPNKSCVLTGRTLKN